ncbi:hypothetical protein CAP36_05890 [Chitinophagaceae bacterium IBVUCB2]|nr:hypothetical protein CAP36_05890 [Chitinophagaceae bacterium IBVUCB2]
MQQKNEKSRLLKFYHYIISVLLDGQGFCVKVFVKCSGTKGFIVFNAKKLYQFCISGHLFLALNFVIVGNGFSKKNLPKTQKLGVKKFAKPIQQSTSGQSKALIHIMLIFEGCNFYL